jgi:hypothetical protein
VAAAKAGAIGYLKPRASGGQLFFKLVVFDVPRRFREQKRAHRFQRRSRLARKYLSHER